MQKVAAYRLEIFEGMQDANARQEKIREIRAVVDRWLIRKGVNPAASSGPYSAQDGGKASFVIEEVRDAERTWWFVKLQEASKEGKKVDAALSVTKCNDRAMVYMTLEVGSETSQATPGVAEARPPGLIRDLMQIPGPWLHARYTLQPCRRVEGFDDGEKLVSELLSMSRTVPLIVVSEDSAGLPLPDLDAKLGQDLLGLANVVSIDSDASWALTDTLGTGLSCFRGTTRLYWPRFIPTDDPYRHPRWTATRLRTSGNDMHAVRDRFRRQMLRVVMHASALNTVKPLEIDEIRAAAANRGFAELKARAKSLEDFSTIADLYADENSGLRDKIAQLAEQNQVLQFQLSELEASYTTLQTRAENAEQNAALVYKHRPPAPPENIAPDVSDDEDPEQPQPGDIRFYKKKYATPHHDVMVRVNDCGHDNWEPARAGEKAKKGIAKLEGDNSWKTLAHCDTCTGGGMWCVKW